MRLITFEPKDFLTALLLFFAGCWSYPPEAVTINTPVVATEKISGPSAQEIFLTFTLWKDQLTYRTETSEAKGPDQSVNARDETALEGLIVRNLENAKNKNRELVVFIETGREENRESFNALLAALRKKEIYKYQLITRPE